MVSKKYACNVAFTNVIGKVFIRVVLMSLAVNMCSLSLCVYIDLYAYIEVGHSNNISTNFCAPKLESGANTLAFFTAAINTAVL
jgi:hypothetical protein